MQKRISFYDVDWDRRRAAGGVSLTFDDRSQADLRPLSAEELGLLANVLRSEKPVYYDAETETLSTRQTLVGG
jgi:hypothetical protein